MIAMKLKNIFSKYISLELTFDFHKYNLYLHNQDQQHIQAYIQ